MHCRARTRESKDRQLRTVFLVGRVVALSAGLVIALPLHADEGHKPRKESEPTRKAPGHRDDGHGAQIPMKDHGAMPTFGPTPEEGQRLVEQLHCNACHSIPGMEHGMAVNGGGHGQG